MVDTKSVNNTTLLHFLERTVAKHFPEMEEFLEEIAKPAEAYRIHLAEIRKGLTDLRNGLKTIRQELGEYFADMDQSDRYGAQMWNFIGKANSRLEDLTDNVNLADTTFTEVLKYYGEEDKNVTSGEFYGIFKTFVTSYKKCKVDNQTAAEERSANEKRKQAAEDAKVNRQKVREAAQMQTDDDSAVLDKLIGELGNGMVLGRRSRKHRPTVDTRSNQPPTLDSIGGTDIDESERALDMLAQLRADGFEAPMPESPSIGAAQRRRRRRTEANKYNPPSRTFIPSRN
ncbi:RhoA GTPase effector DIA/Diaphanous [Salix suchowensis]|nr:RhoA GTPase effector DIA/Diaphanous [Salix suchowensis]